MYKFSKFAHFFEKEEEVCVYNSLKMNTTYINKNIKSKLISIVKNDAPVNDLDNDIKRIWEDLIDKEIIIPYEIDENEYMEKINKDIFKGPNIKNMVLHLTDFCNLRCKYCFIEGEIDDKYIRRHMSKETIKESIDYYMEIIIKKDEENDFAITFYGGEPLMNWEVMEYGLEYLEKFSLNNKIAKHMITNGMFLTDEICKSLKKHNVNVIFSIDGPKENHDNNRVDLHGNGSFDKTYEAFKLAEKYGLNPSISSVLPKENLKDVEKIINWFIKDLKVKGIGFNHVSIIPDVNDFDDKYEKEFGDAILKGQEIVLENNDIYERRMSHKRENFEDGNILISDCTGCGEQMSISTLGEIGICQGYMGRRKTFNCSVKDKEYDVEKDPVFIEWSYRSPLTMRQCWECEALSICGGGCPRNADFLKGSIWERDEAYCYFAKKAVEWLVWKKKKSMN